MRLFTLTVIALCSFLSAAGLARADDKADRDRKAKAAIAVATALSRSAAPAVAPVPRAPTPKDYATGHKESLLDQSPLVVYVACTGPKVEGAITCQTDSETFGPVKGPAVVVGYPQGSRLLIDTTLTCPADPKDVKKAVDKAARKIEVPPAKVMPAAPSPLNTQIRATPGEGCICGPDCKCAVGTCPACPVRATAAAAKPEPVIVGYRYEKFCTPQGCQLVQVPVYR